jgi:uncharacterized protein (PEP-CTERM system associated)
VIVTGRAEPPNLPVRSRLAARVAVRHLLWLLVWFATGASAQSQLLSDSAAYGGRGVGAAGGPGGNDSVGGGGRVFFVTPTLSANATLTNNVNLSATDKQAALILDIIPGITLGMRLGRNQLSVGYSLTCSFYTAGGDSGCRDSLQNALAAGANFEVVDNWLWIDASASISQQYISPFGTQSSASTLNNPNLTEVRTFSVAPYVRGQIAGEVDYTGRVFYTTTNSGSSDAADSTVFGGILSFSASTRWSKLSWGLDLTYREVSFSDRRNEFDQLNIFSLIYAVTPELRVSARVNSETSNLVSLDTETTTGYGGGLRWNPSPRTNLVIEYDQRIFGSSHLYSFDYRTPRTVWSISSFQGLSTGQTTAGAFGGRPGSSGSTFDLLFAQFATIEPDPVLRAQLVNNFMKANGINANASPSTAFLPSQVTEELRQQASVAWLGQRSTAVLNVYQTQAQSLQPQLLNPDDDFSGGNVIRWRGISLTGSHRLTPTSSLTLTLSQSQSGESVGTQSTTLRNLYALWSTTVGRRTTATLGARYQNFSSSTAPYTEAALLANLSMTF